MVFDKLGRELKPHIRESNLLFVGLYPKYSFTREGRPKLVFTASCGINEPDKLKFPTWRRIKLFGDMALGLQELKAGQLVEVSGFITTEPRRNQQGNVLYIDDKPETLEYLIADNVRIIPYEKRQSPQMELIPDASG